MSINTPVGSYALQGFVPPESQEIEDTQEIEHTQEGDVNDDTSLQEPPAQGTRPPLVRTYAIAGALLTPAPTDSSN